MSTPNPTHIDVIIEHTYLVEYGQVCCLCGWESETVNADSEHAAHVVSKLTDAGYSITPTSTLANVACECLHPRSEHTGLHDSCDFAIDTWWCPCEGFAAAAAEGEKP